MPTDQYHEPPSDLSPDIRTFARMAASLQEEEFKHFAMALEFLSRRKPKWRAVLQEVLFKPGNIVEHGEQGEEAEKKVPKKRAR